MSFLDMAQADLKLGSSYLSLPGVLGKQVCATVPGRYLFVGWEDSAGVTPLPHTC